MAEKDATGESGGLFSSLLSSFRSNVDERIKSPFTGAFVLTWLVINWQPVLYFILTDKPVEFRLAYVDAKYFSWATTFWLPLAWSFVALASFYLFSSIYLAISEVYGLARSRIERWFDQVTWISPSDYIAFKRGFQEKISDLSELAADKLKRIDDLQDKVRHVETEKLGLLSRIDELEADNSAASDEFNEKVQEISVIHAQAQDLSAERARLQSELNRISSEFSQMQRDQRLEIESLRSLLDSTRMFIESQAASGALDAASPNAEQGIAAGLLRRFQDPIETKMARDAILDRINSALKR